MSPADALTQKPRDWSLLRLATGLIIGSVLLAALLVPLTEREISLEAETSKTFAQLSMQRAADVLADKTRSLITSLQALVRLATLHQRTTQCCSQVEAELVKDTLYQAVNQSPLGIRSVSLFDPAGGATLQFGEDPPGNLTQDDHQPGFGLPWRTRSGRQVVHVTYPVPDLPGWTLRATIDLDILATASEVALQDHATALLIRLSDGAILASLPVESEQLATGPSPAIRYANKQAVELFNQNDHGWFTANWGIPTDGSPSGQTAKSPTTAPSGTPAGDSMNYAFVTMPEFGLVMAATTPQQDVQNAAASRAQTLRLIPAIVLLVALLATVLTLVVLTRRRAKAEIEQEQRLAIAESAARSELEYLVSCSPAMLYRGRLSPAGQFFRDYLTPNTLEVTGWRPASLADEAALWNLLPEEDRYLVNGNYARALREGRSAAEYRCQRPDGTLSWLRNEVVVVTRNEDGSAEIAGAITNISREREISAYAAMQNRLATLGEISASLAHELTQPMTVIGIAAAIAQGLVAKTQLDPELGRQLQSIISQTDRASDIIRHLRSYGRGDGGPLDDISLSAAANGALSLAGMSLREAEVKVSIDIPENLPTVRARQVQVEQVIVNLLINARDAMRATPNSARRIVLRGKTTAETIRLEVEDTGPGVPASLIERLFEPFYTTKEPGEGTGLGLALCQAMMRQFGGSIAAANGRHGAVFSLDFPRNQHAPRAEPAIIATTLPN